MEAIVKLLLLLMAVTAQAAKDKDGDGILDKEDLCPQAAEDMDDFEDDDGCPELDNDRDGKLDDMDQCPLVPEDKDQFQDKDGCPDPDNDEDGVADVDDACPNLEGTSAGCPDPALVALTNLDNLLQVDDIASVPGLFAATAYDENLVGDSGMTGREIYSEAKSEGWFVRPHVMAVETVGSARLVKCDVVARATDKPLDQVHMVLVEQDGTWKILGGGEDEAQARALASKQD